MIYEKIEIHERRNAQKSLQTKFLSRDTAIKLGPERVDIVAQVVLDSTSAMDEREP